jgi:hypothetical protein
MGHGGRLLMENIYGKSVFFHYREKNLQAGVGSFP